MAAAEFRALGDYLGSQILGQGSLIEGLLIALLCEGHVLIRGSARPCQDPGRQGAGRRRRGALRSHPVHPGPAPCRSHRQRGVSPPGCQLRVPARPPVQPPGAGGRDKPGPGQGAVRPAGGHGRAADHRGQEELAPAAALYGGGHAKPHEQEGTYPLPEAQLNRFLLKLMVDYPSPAMELAILQLNAGGDAAAAAPRDPEPGRLALGSQRGAGRADAEPGSSTIWCS